MVTTTTMNGKSETKATETMSKKDGKSSDGKSSDGKSSDGKSSAGKNGAAKTKGKGRAVKASSPPVESIFDGNPALKTALQQIEKQFGEGSIMPLGAERRKRIEGISTGSLSLDIALGGQGLPRGRIIEIYGPESSGKTTLALHVMAQAQKTGGIAAFIDAEHAFDPTWAKKLGVSTWTRCWSASRGSGEEAMQITEMLIKSNAVDVIVVDSVAALVPKKELEGEIGDSHVGLQARLMSQSMRKLTGAIAKSKTVTIFINQIREKIGVMFGSPETTPGGRALKFYSSCRIDVRRIGAVEGRRRGRRPTRPSKDRQEQGGSAVPRRRIRHDAHRRHQLRRRPAGPGRDAQGHHSQRSLVQKGRTVSGARQGKARAVLAREPGVGRVDSQRGDGGVGDER